MKLQPYFLSALLMTGAAVSAQEPEAEPVDYAAEYADFYQRYPNMTYDAYLRARLGEAIETGNASAAENLLEMNAQPPENALKIALKNELSDPLVNRLIEQGAPINDDALKSAFANGRADIARTLIASGQTSDPGDLLSSSDIFGTISGTGDAETFSLASQYKVPEKYNTLGFSADFHLIANAIYNYEAAYGKSGTIDPDNVKKAIATVYSLGLDINDLMYEQSDTSSKSTTEFVQELIENIMTGQSLRDDPGDDLDQPFFGTNDVAMKQAAREILEYLNAAAEYRLDEFLAGRENAEELAASLNEKFSQNWEVRDVQCVGYDRGGYKNVDILAHRVPDITTATLVASEFKSLSIYQVMGCMESGGGVIVVPARYLSAAAADPKLAASFGNAMRAVSSYLKTGPEYPNLKTSPKTPEL